MYIICLFLVLASTKCFLAFKFDMKDMSKASVIFSIKIIWRDNSIMLTQKQLEKKNLICYFPTYFS
jgi:hypothetical protein